MKRILFILIAFSNYLPLAAQPGALDLSFDPGAGTNAQILATAIQSDGKIIIGGFFTTYDGAAVNHIARLLEDGSLDTSFHIGTGTDHGVYTLVIQPDGKIIIAGGFTEYDSTPVNRIARLNADGSADTSFHTGTGFNHTVRSIAIQPDGKIVAGGEFTNYNGSARNYLVRLNEDGSLDNGFNIGSGANGTVEVVAIQPSDGKIMIGGSFTLYGINPGLRVARVNTNGSPDTGFNTLLGGTSHSVFAIAVQNDGKIMIGGDFTNYNGNPINRFVRVNPNGSIDVSFHLGQASNSTVRAIQTSPNGEILLGGNFTSYDGTSINRIARLKTTGLTDATFQTGTGANGGLFSISIQHNSKIIIAGIMTAYNDSSRNGIARLYSCFTTQPDTIVGNDTTICPGEVHIYSVSQGADAESYEWTLPSGWTGSSDSASIIAISNGQGGVISVKAFSDSCGYSIQQTKTIYRIQPPDVPLCLVTVDDSSTHNVLIWEKPADKSLIDSFVIYRETTTGIYSKIASVHRDSLSEYHDFAANPNTTSYRYKLSILDICGVEAAQSPFHNTIHLQNLGNGNFQWTFYQIENSLNPVVSFNVYRDALGNGNFFPIGNVPGTNATFTDISYAAFPNSEYVVDVNWGISCTPQRGTINTTRSNIRKINQIDVGGIETGLPESIEIYPNPAESEITLSFPASTKIVGIRLFNSLGKVVWIRESWNDNHSVIQIGMLPKGIYLLTIETNSGNIKKKVIIQ